MSGKKVLYRMLSCALIMSLSIAVLITPVKAKADFEPSVNGKTVAGLGTSIIRNPDKGAGGWSYVYFGKYDTPMKFRVLANKTDAYGGNTMYLDCDRCVTQLPFGSENNEVKNMFNYDARWKNGVAWTWLNGDEFLNKRSVFTEQEFSSIFPSNRIEGSLVRKPSGDYVFNLTETPVENDKIFIIGCRDFFNTTYGYAGSDVVQDRTRVKEGANFWAIRSSELINSDPEDAICLIGVFNNYYVNEYQTAHGFFYHNYVNQNGDFAWIMWFLSTNPTIAGVSPAMNIDLSKILFSSLVSGTAGAKGAEYKLTLLDDDIDLSFDDDDITIERAEVSISFSVSGSNADSVNRISVLMTDKKYSDKNAKIMYYAPLQVRANDSTGYTGTFTAPDNYNSNWKTYLIAEDVNGKYETDYSSTPVEFILPENRDLTKKEQVITAPVAIKHLAYNGEEQVLIEGARVEQGNKENGSILYSLDKENWSTELPKGKNSDVYIVYYKVLGNDEYRDSPTKSIRTGIMFEQPQIVKRPEASEIIEGQSLSSSVLSNWVVEGVSGNITGRFRWAQPYTVPSLADSETTSYLVEFIPDDDNYCLNACVITVKVKPASQKYDVTVKNGMGSAECSEGFAVNIIADKPPTGKLFDKWVSDDDVIFEDATSEITSFIMPAKDVTVTATYKDDPLAPVKKYSAVINNGSGDGEYAEGESITITADNPADGKLFDKWISDDGVKFADATSATTTFIMPAKAVTVTATYKDKTEPNKEPIKPEPVNPDPSMPDQKPEDNKAQQSNSEDSIKNDQNKAVTQHEDGSTTTIEDTQSADGKRGIKVTETDNEGNKTLQAEYQLTSKNTLVLEKVDTTERKLKIPDTMTGTDGNQYPITELGENALRNNSFVTSVTLGKNITKLSANSLRNMKKLKNLTAKGKIKEIGNNALKGCINLKTIKMNVSKVKKVGKNCLPKTKKKLTFKAQGTKKQVRKFDKKLTKSNPKRNFMVKRVK